MPLDLSNDITKRHEDQLHTYTALFSPPTPRASPTPDEQAKEESWRRRSYRANYGDAGGGSGMGMIVPDMQDPLSVPVLFAHHGELGEKNYGYTDTDADSMVATGNSNSSLAFFDKFVSEARAASEIKRRSVLDEILLHQDDPLFRWSSRSTKDDQDDGGEELQEEIQNTENTAELGKPGPCTVPERPEQRHEAGERVESPTHSPKRSPTLTSLPTLAPPLESTDTVSATTDTVDPSLTSSSYSHSSDSSTRSPYATLSGLHSRWASSLLNHKNARNTGIPSSLPANTHMPSSFTSASFTTSTSTAKPLPPRTITRPHTVTNSNPNSNAKSSAHVRPSSVGSISSHSSSPFASHMSVPISGAPGFFEERYNWDKGFSDELIKELEDIGGNTVEEGRTVKTDSDQSDRDKSDTADTRRFLKLKMRGTKAKENLANGTTRMLGKTQLTQTLIAGSGISRMSKKDKDKDKDAMKRTRGATSIPVVSPGPSGSLGVGGPLNNKNHERGWSETLERGKGNGDSNEARNETRYGGRLFSELIEKKLGSVELKGRKEMTTPVLDVTLADSLRTHLPALDRLPKTWTLVYSLDQHGISLNTLYTRCEAHTQAQAQSQSRLGSTGGSRIIGSGARPGMIVVVKDSGDSLFGVWIGDGVRQSRGKGYYGSGESFMWRYRNVELDVYKWTGKNKYVVLGEPDYISFGGGEGKYGLYLDETLFEGSSARCPTFDNEPLCSPGANKAGAVAFECVGLEVWGVGP